MTYREVKDKRRLVLVVPAELFERMDRERFRTKLPYSEIGAMILAEHFGIAPSWKLRKSARKPKPQKTGA
jgi:hypothetical protein